MLSGVLAATVATVLTLTPQCSDDKLSWNAGSEADLAGYRVRLDGAVVATLPPQTPTYLLGCATGTACVTAIDKAGNESSLACIPWVNPPCQFGVDQCAVFGPCNMGCKPARLGGCCTAPLR